MVVPTKSLNNDLSSYGIARSTISATPLSDEEARKTHAFWRACNYLALGMIYLQDNPLLRDPLTPEHIKNRMLGHWGASPALSFIYTHLNRVIKTFDLDMIFMAGPGSRRARRARAGLSRRRLLGNLSGQEPGRRRSAPLLQAVLVSGRHRQSLHARNARLDS